MTLKSPVLLRGHVKILKNLLTWVHKSIPKFPVLLEGYKLFFKKGGNLDVQMSVSIEENISLDVKMEVKRWVQILT